MSKKIRVFKIFKIIISLCIMVAIFLSVISCKEEMIEEEVVEEEAIVKEEGSPETEGTTQNETTPIEEKTPEEIEWEGVTFSPIEGLRFGKGIFYFLEGNEYGGVVGEKAGVCITDGPEVNGQTTWFGFKKEVLEVMQKKIMEEKKEFRYPLPFDFEKVKGIKIREIKMTDVDELYKSHDLFWDNNVTLEILNIPLGAKIYSPLNTTYYLVWDNNLGRNDPNELSRYGLHFGLFPSVANKESVLFKDERVDNIDLEISALGLSLLPPGIEKNITKKGGGHFFLTEIKIGEPIAEVLSEKSIEIDYGICQFKNKDDKLELYQIDSSKISKASYFGLNGLLKIGDIPVFISPVYE